MPGTGGRGGGVYRRKRGNALNRWGVDGCTYTWCGK